MNRAAVLLLILGACNSGSVDDPCWTPKSGVIQSWVCLDQEAADAGVVVVESDAGPSDPDGGAL